MKIRYIIHDLLDGFYLSDNSGWTDNISKAYKLHSENEAIHEIEKFLHVSGSLTIIKIYES